jgi:hypothetical protein
MVGGLTTASSTTAARLRLCSNRMDTVGRTAAEAHR